jgi:hypothetical protein
MQPVPSDPVSAASWAHAIFLAIGISAHWSQILASTVGLYVFVKAFAGDFMAFLPVADANSDRWYRGFYGVLARNTGNYRNNAPVPPSLELAGGIVPSPPFMKPPTEEKTHA